MQQLLKPVGVWPRVIAMEEEALFGDFDDSPPPPAKRSRPAAAAPIGSEARGGSSLPLAFAHLHHEAVVSISFRGMADQERLRLEEVLRECVVVSRKGGTPHSTDDDTVGTPQIAAADTVHYFRACPLGENSACPPCV